jgi:PhnB protein
MAGTIAHYRTVMPYLVVADADRELAFLTAAFGAAERECHRNPDGTVLHAELTIGDSVLMVGQANDQWKPLLGALYLWIEDVDATYEKALAAGGTSQSPPSDKPYGHREAGVVDPNGVTWWLGAPSR